MKAEYTRAIKTISGRIGSFVHLKRKTGLRAVIRQFVKPKAGDNNHNFGAVTKNSAVIWKECSTGFRSDLKRYAGYLAIEYSGEEIPALTNFAHFVRFLYRFRDLNPGIDLAVISKSELEAAGAPASVREIIEQGLLPAIPEYQDLTEKW
jgi:hypothetical protein